MESASRRELRCTFFLFYVVFDTFMLIFDVGFNGIVAIDYYFCVIRLNNRI